MSTAMAVARPSVMADDVASMYLDRAAMIAFAVATTVAVIKPTMRATDDVTSNIAVSVSTIGAGDMAYTVTTMAALRNNMAIALTTADVTCVTSIASMASLTLCS